MISRRPLIWSADARADLAEIWNHYAEVAGHNVADGIIRAIGQTARLIEEHPYAGRARDEVRPGLRSLARSPHVIFYRVGADDLAEIVRILDGRRDIEAIFEGERGP